MRFFFNTPQILEKVAVVHCSSTVWELQSHGHPLCFFGPMRDTEWTDLAPTDPLLHDKALLLGDEVHLVQEDAVRKDDLLQSLVPRQQG